MGAILRSGRDTGSEVKVTPFRSSAVRDEFKANGTSCPMDCCVLIASVHLPWRIGGGRTAEVKRRGREIKGV